MSPPPVFQYAEFTLISSIGSLILPCFHHREFVQSLFLAAAGAELKAGSRLGLVGRDVFRQRFGGLDDAPLDALGYLFHLYLRVVVCDTL
jgi:hypothetical protein